MWLFFFFQAEDGIRDADVTGVQTCALFFSSRRRHTRCGRDWSSDVCSSDLCYVAEFVLWLAFLSLVPLSEGVLLRSEEHTSELQSRPHLVCRLLLEKKKGTDMIEK